MWAGPLLLLSRWQVGSWQTEPGLVNLGVPPLPLPSPSQMTHLTWMGWIATSFFAFSSSTQKINIPSIGAWGMSRNFWGRYQTDILFGLL